MFTFDVIGNWVRYMGSVRTVDSASTLRHLEITINKKPQQREGEVCSPKESLKRRDAFGEWGRPYPTLTDNPTQH